MIKIKVTWNNSAGELDSRIVEDFDPTVAERKACDALIEMIAGSPLSDGDTITVQEIE